MQYTTVVRACSVLACTLWMGAVMGANARFYPQPSPVPMEVGGEEFSAGYMSLRGLEGLYVDLSVVMAAGKNKDIVVPDTLEQQVRDKIESAGLFFLTKNEMEVTPGQPMMSLWPQYEDKTLNEDDKQIYGEEDVQVRCENSIWAGFGQSASLLRQPENQYRLNTWGDGDRSVQCEDRGQWMAEAVLRKIDVFIADYKQSEQELTPVLVSKSSDVPELCSQSWVTRLNVFEADEAIINSHVKPIFDRLAIIAQRCNTYRYIIETHTDQYSDLSYEKLLIETRARSIKDYLMSQGMPYSKLKMRPVVEAAQKAQKMAKSAQAKNRRIVIHPVGNEEFRNAELDY